jgi:hypothetical protein
MVTTGVAAILVYAGSALVRRTANHSTPPSGADPTLPTFDMFLALSRIVLARSDLDQSVARRMFEVFMDEPWAGDRILSAYAALRGDATASSSNLGSDDRWFVSHLISTWYLGVYYREGEPPQRIAYAGALMHEAMQGLAPAPFQSVGFGKWSELPAGAEIGR